MNNAITKPQVRLEYLPCVNYAICANKKRCIEYLEIENSSDSDWHNLTIHVSGDMVKAGEARLALVPRGQTVKTTDLEITPDIDKLRELSESVETLFTLTIRRDSETLYEETFPLRILAFNEWPGINIMPDILAAYVTPNAPILTPVMVEAAKTLGRLTGSEALDEYQTQDPNRVRAQVAAIYEALRKTGMVYCAPPASFERTGQRIRMADEVMEGKIATCADSSLLMASCMECCGLRPLVIMPPGHMFVGCWLVERNYHQVVGDDVSFLSKAIKSGINEIVVVETTKLTQNGVTFEEAVKAAEDYITNNMDNIMLFVDIHRCRLSGIKPLPSKVDGQWVSDGITRDTITTDVKQQTTYDIPSPSGQPVTRQQIWERKLLDFSLRNNLLNLRLGKRFIPFISFDIHLLEDRLQAKEDFHIMPCPLKKGINPNEYGMYDSHLFENELYQLVTEGLKSRQLNSYLTDEELKTAIKHLFRASRTALEENGANTLFLVLGLLKWFETSKSIRPRYAPLILVPVSIVKKSGNNYVIRVRDEETTFNTTLVEMLKQQYEIDLSDVAKMPEDESGVDVKLIFSAVRAHLRNQSKWDIVEEAMLGLFSFSKFVMWNDIHNNASLLHENPIVASLIEKRLVNFVLPEPIDPRQIDEQMEPGSYAIPVDVDSSQLEAVVESGEGRSFILHGPPGTGKSQTITNMIANALFHDRRVLFVAEKMAALEVVQKRLQKIGIDAFCLELHSNKVTKSHLLQQLQAALDITRYKAPEEYAAESKALFEQRKSLLQYITALHKVRPIGLSLNDIINLYLAVPTTDTLTPTEAYLESIGLERMRQADQIIRQLETVFAITGLPHQHPLNGLDIKDASMSGIQQAGLTAGKLQPLAPMVTNTMRQLREQSALNIPMTPQGAQYCLQLLTMVRRMPCLTPQLLALNENAEQTKSWKDIIAHGKRRDGLMSEIYAYYQPQILSLNHQLLNEQWKDACDKWFIPRFFAKRKIVKSLKTYRSNMQEAFMKPLLEQLTQYHAEANFIQANTQGLTTIFGTLAQPGNEQWQKMEDCFRMAANILTLSAPLRKPGVALNISSHLNQIDITALQEWQSITVSAQDICTLSDTLNMEEAETRIAQWQAHLHQARDWAQWTTRKLALHNMHLDNVVQYIEKEGHGSTQAANALLRGTYEHLGRQVIDQDPALQMFNGLLFEDMIKAYREKDKAFRELTKRALYCRLASRIPSQTLAAAGNSEMGILKRYIKSGGRGVSIRQIIDQIPTLLPRLCPCMLMSPISVAQFIDLNQEKFDIVTFDEASQMPTSEAVGAIARGKALICVGDPQQMPPTSFFTTTQVDDSDAENDDMESILDDCITLSMPSHYLTWHYRSRHESLIAFSNSQFYDNRLYTFPSVDDRRSKVTFIPIDGIYDMGKTRCNRAEAEAIVKEIVRRLSDDQLSLMSIGVVAFSKVQQNLIEDILTDELAKHPDLETKAYDCAEPIFIKNLENVQGDERDVILFSVGYGPDKRGHVSMNFGPLNNQGGERRLNVAVSRARCEMMVFSTLQPEQIDLNRSNAKGVEGLKRFLEFAKNGRLSLSAAQIEATPKSGLVADIAKALENDGYAVDTQVGRSRFKIDIAIIDPDDPERYLMGILCDGKNYYETKTLRDREVTQPSVLQGLGWNLMRVWSVDWFMNREGCLERIRQKIKELKEDKPQPDDVKEEKPAATLMATAAPNHLPFSVSESDKIEMTDNEHHRPYEKADIPTRGSYASIDELKMRNNGILNFNYDIKGIIITEQPVTLSWLCKRMKEAYGFPRMTPKLKDCIRAAASQMGYRDPQSSPDNPVFWLNAESSNDYTVYRDIDMRDIDDIALVELTNMIRSMMEEQVSVPMESLKLQVAKMGFSKRRTDRGNEATEVCVRRLEKEGFVSLSANGVVSLR